MVAELEALLGTNMISAMERMFNMHNLKASQLDTVAECEAPKYQNDRCNGAHLLYAKVGVIIQQKKIETHKFENQICLQDAPLRKTSPSKQSGTSPALPAKYLVCSAWLPFTVAVSQKHWFYYEKKHKDHEASKF